MPARPLLLPIAILVLLSAGCLSGDADADVGIVRDTLPGGIERVRYTGLRVPSDTVRPDLRIGALDGAPELVFGDVRGIDAGRDGTIYVLDYQASEIRAFDAQGKFLRTVATRGEGPGEISEANGMTLGADDTLWVQDHGKWMMLGITTEGREVARVPMHVLSYGYMWNGTVDVRGRFWKPVSHSKEERQPTFPPPEGLMEGSSLRYLKVFDPGEEATDSVYLGEVSTRTYISRNTRGGYSYRGIPFEAQPLALVDPEGGFWEVHTAQYRIARLDERGDTVRVIEVDMPRRAVTPQERDAWMATMSERDDMRALEAIAALMPGVHPVIEAIGVDDRGRLWVRRTAAEGEAPIYDVFERSGDYVGSLAFGFEPFMYFPLRVRDGRFYAVVRDSMQVPFVVRATLPEPFAEP